MVLNKINAFVSSKTKELFNERIIVKSALKDLFLDVFVFEDDAGARTESTQQVYRQEVEECDICICIFDKEYSEATKEEYHLARANNKEILTYVSNAETVDRNPKLQNLLGEIKTNHTVQEYDNLKQLEEFVKRDIMKLFFRKFNELNKTKTRNETKLLDDFYTIHDYLIRNGPLNPDFLKDVNPIAGEIIAVWNALGYKITKFEVVDKTVDFQGEISDWTGTRRVIIRCVDGEVSYDDVKFVKVFVKNNPDFSGYVFTYNRIAPSAKELASQPPVILVQTQSEFYRKLLNPEKYMTFLRDKFKKSDIAKYYVRLNCYKENNQQGIEPARERFGDLEQYVDTWLSDKSKKQISILGEFGTGKTWFCLQYAMQCLQKYIQDPYNNRLPILISLRDYSKSYDIEQLITDLLLNEYGFNIKNYEMFNVLNNQGKFLLIFDGFDEMAVRVDYGVVLDNFWELAKVVVSNSKVLLTCRTTHFRYAIESENILGGKEKSQNVTTINKPGFEILHLEEFSEEKIIEVMTRRIGNRETALSYWNKLKPIYDIPSIANKPVLIPMLIDVMPNLIDLEVVNPAIIYHIYTDQWISQSLKEGRSYLKSKWDKLYFITEIAWQMIKTKDLKIFWKEIPDFINRHFNFDKKEIDYYEHDLRNNSFLKRDDKGVFEFTHKSMAEFFVAYKFALELGTAKKEYAKDVPFENIKQRSISELATTFGHTLLTPEILLFLQDIVDNRPAIRELFDRSRENNAESTAFVSSNLITLLLMMGESFSSQNISLANMPGSDLKGRTLIDCNLDGGNLSKSNMEGAILRKSSFNDSNLSVCRLIHSDCSEIKGDGTNLSNCDCSMANLSNSELTHSNLSNSIFTKADLSEMILTNALIKGSDFSSSDLSNSNLENSHIENCIFDGTILSNVSLKNSQIIRCNFHTISIDGLRIDGCDVSHSLFENLNVQKTRMTDKKLTYTTFLSSDFYGSHFNSSILEHCDFHRSDLSNCDFADAILIDTILRETDLSNSNFSGTDLTGVDLHGIKSNNIIQTDDRTKTNKIKIDSKTLQHLPKNFQDIIIRDNPEYIKMM